MTQINRSKLELILSMCIFGTIGIVRRYIPLSSSVIACARAVIGVLFLLLVCLASKRRASISSIRRNIPLLVMSGVLLGSNWICLFEAYRYTSVSVATVCYYCAPVFVLLLSPAILHEHLSLKKALCAATALAGMVLVSGVLKTSVYGLRGVFLGLAAAVMYAMIVIMNKRMSETAAMDRTIIQLLVAAVSLMVYVCLTEDVRTLDFTPTVCILLLTAGIIHTGLAYAMYFSSFDKLKAQTAAIYSYIDPVVAVVLSVIVLGEQMDPEAIGGAILVLGATMAADYVD